MLTHTVSTYVNGDFAELFEGGFEVFDDFLGENVGIREVVGFFEAFVSEPEDVEAGFVALVSSSSPLLHDRRGASMLDSKV